MGRGSVVFGDTLRLCELSGCFLFNRRERRGRKGVGDGVVRYLPVLLCGLCELSGFF